DGNPVLHNVSNEFDVGPHMVSETGLPGYAAGDWGGDCNSDGSITLTLGQQATCTITNDDISPTITVFKNIMNDNGGMEIDENAFGLMVDGNPVSHNVATDFDAGLHTVSETGLAGYEPGLWGGDCNPDGTITLTLDQDATCTITNDDISPTITVFKNIVNDDGGTEMDENAFGLMVDGNPVQHNVSNEFDAGPHTVSESGLAGYEPGLWGGDCNQDGTITLTLGQDATCTITNDDISPTITVFKSIVNDNGGTETDENAFGLMVDGNLVLHNVANEFDAGPHTVSEAGLAGYEPGTWGGDCEPDGSITLTTGQDATCTITNDDISPSITVVNNIINNNGGMEMDENAFGLMVNGSAVQNNATNDFDVGSYTVSQSGLPGYAASQWGGDCNPDGSITLAIGQAAVCTITNDDISPTITVFKNIVNDNGGTEMDENAFGLMVDGNPVQHNVTNDFDAGLHNVSEAGLAGYASGDWGGDCNPDGSITLTLDQDATCIITNDDISPTITVFKNIINDNGGMQMDENAFGLMVDGSPVQHNVINDYDAGPHTVSETGLPGYIPGPWGGDCEPDGTITLALGQDATCTITNDDSDETSLTLQKTVTNNNGGSAGAISWTLVADGPSGFSGQGPSVSSGAGFLPGTYDLSENGGPAGYSASDWVCAGGTQDDADTITLVLGESAICTITNDDISPTLTVFKNIVNDSGGGITDENAFGLMVDGNTVQHNVSNEFNAGLHTVSEAGLPDYEPSDWGGDCNPDGTITLALAQDATCTITNDDINQTSLTLNKIVITNNGGTDEPQDWTLTASGPSGFSGPGPSVSSQPDFQPGTYDLSESGPPGYAASAWDCVGGTQDDDDTITIALDDSVVCTITNDDISPTITVFKTIINDSGGTITDENEFGLQVDGNPVQHDVPTDVDAGAHIVSETGQEDYTPGPWGGDCNSDGSITLALAEDATCTITNDDINLADILLRDGFEGSVRKP
ncbi:MAG TPA: hypothetical protein VJ984_04040, partial [Xanthomonadales bacterium]|nr:hypothetical protein [Xanthomonadales bacterium]